MSRPFIAWSKGPAAARVIATCAAARTPGPSLPRIAATAAAAPTGAMVACGWKANGRGGRMARA